MKLREANLVTHLAGFEDPGIRRYRGTRGEVESNCLELMETEKYVRKSITGRKQVDQRRRKGGKAMGNIAVLGARDVKSCKNRLRSYHEKDKLGPLLN
jgi:hypothetical protein